MQKQNFSIFGDSPPLNSLQTKLTCEDKDSMVGQHLTICAAPLDFYSVPIVGNSPPGDQVCIAQNMCIYCPILERCWHSYPSKTAVFFLDFSLVRVILIYVLIGDVAAP